MKIIQSAAFIALLAGAASAATVNCVIPTAAPLNVLPPGCQALLTNGPIFFNGVTDSSGDVHNIEIDTLALFGLAFNGAGEDNHVNVFIQAQDTNVTTQTTSG